MAGQASKKVKVDAEAERIGAEFGLGRHLKVWQRGPKVVERVLLGWFLIAVLATVPVVALMENDYSRWEAPIAWAVGVGYMVPFAMALRSKWPVLHEYEAGLANVTRLRRRVSVVLWADLTSMHAAFSTDDHGKEHFNGYVLCDRWGGSVRVRRHNELVIRASQILADPLNQPTN